MKETFLTLLSVLCSALMLAQEPVQQGTITVRKKAIPPFFRVQYSYSKIPREYRPGKLRFLERPRKYDEVRPGQQEKYFLEYPRRTGSLSQLFAAAVQAVYEEADTPRTDTIRIRLTLGKGKLCRIKAVEIRNGDRIGKHAVTDETVAFAKNMLVNALWGSPGGYSHERKKPVADRTFFAEEFYCDVLLIVASFPLTYRQRYEGMNYCLADEELTVPQKKR